MNRLVDQYIESLSEEKQEDERRERLKRVHDALDDEVERAGEVGARKPDHDARDRRD